MDELCAQQCDDDIKNAIGCLLKTLAETFSRALMRITSRRKTSVAVKTFSWVAIAKRPLALDELREAMSVEIGQPYLMPERLINGIDQLASWCENLVHVDEELKTVQFAHQAIQKFVIEGPTEPQLRDFRVNLAKADHHAGEICVTYLGFNDFKTTLARRPQPIKLVDPVAIATVALSPNLSALSAIPRFGLSSRRHKSKAKLDVVGLLSSYGRENSEQTKGSLEQAYPFLEYVSTHWISHTSRFRKGSTASWDLWHQIVTCGHDLAKKPWPEQRNFDAQDETLLNWSLQSRHYALVRLLQGFDGISKAERRNRMGAFSAKGDVELLDALLEGDDSLEVTNLVLEAASEGGHLGVVERLLRAGADVNADPSKGFGHTALQAASKGGHLDVVEQLLRAGADVNADPSKDYGYAALQAASEGGYLGVFERLLIAEAQVSADLPQDYYGRTALQAASEGGHLGVVERLLMAGANVNADPPWRDGHTALQAACRGGHLGVVERLLMAGADVNAKPAWRKGYTALQAASRGGHLEVVERLIIAGADVNTDAAKHHGRTALQAASEGGYLGVVEHLLTAGANVNAGPAWGRGYTALQAACGGGHLKVVERLLMAGANAAAAPAEMGGKTAHHAASVGGHFEVVKLLKAWHKRGGRGAW